MGKAGLIAAILFLFVTCKEKECTLINEHPEGRDWFAGISSDTILIAYTNDSLHAIFNCKKEQYDYTNYTVCPIERGAHSAELKYSNPLYSEEFYLKVFNFNERAKVEIGVIDKGFTLYDFYLDELQLNIWNDFRGFFVEDIGDTVIRGKTQVGVYRIKLSDDKNESGTLKYLLFSKHSGVIEYSSQKENTWIFQ
jgi:hypothetical protein